MISAGTFGIVDSIKTIISSNLGHLSSGECDDDGAMGVAAVAVDVTAVDGARNAEGPAALAAGS